MSAPPPPSKARPGLSGGLDTRVGCDGRAPGGTPWPAADRRRHQAAADYRGHC